MSSSRVIPPLGPRARAAGSVALAIAILAGAYVWLAIDAGRIGVWNAVVHESGRYTFGQTVLYFSHFLREVPVAIAYALFIVAAVEEGREGTRRWRRGAWALLGAFALVVVAFLLESRARGADSAWRDLLQYRTRDELSDFGSHWRFHWLSTLWAGIAAPLWARFLKRDPSGGSGSPPAIRWVAWGYFGLATAVFGLSTDIVADPRYMGHQAREILAFGTLFLPLVAGVLLLDGAHLPGPTRDFGGTPWVRLALVVTIPACLGGATLATGAMEATRPEASPAALVAAHYWEHVPDLAFCLLLALALHHRPIRARR